MILRRLAAAAGTGIALLSGSTAATAAQGQSTFVSPQNDISFGITVPFMNESTTDIYFTIAASSSLTWAAIGLGSNTMEGCLVLMIYQAASWNGVTLSPRVSNAHVEPSYHSDFNIERLKDEVVNNTMVYSGRCSNCRNWPGGQFDGAGENVKGIYATGPSGDLKSDSKTESIRYHYNYGGFTIDMQYARGPGNAPDLNSTTENSGASLAGKNESGKRDWTSVLHGLAMIFCFIGLMPFGVVILRVGQSVRWHWMNQTLAMAGVIIGAGIGIYDSTYYTRSKSFNTAHQILGLVVTAFVLGQFLLGFFHHRAFKRTQQTTKMAPIHIWLGRVVIILATVNAFLGFPLALDPHWDYALAGLVVVIYLAVGFLLFTRGVFSKLFGGKKRQVDQGPRGYDPEPWRHLQTPAGSNHQPYDDGSSGYGGYESAQHGMDVGLTDIGSSEYGGGHRKERSLGGEQVPKEYV